MYLRLHQRYLLPQLAHQLILLPLCLLAWRLRRQQSLQFSNHSLVFTSVGLGFLGLLDGYLLLHLSLIVIVGPLLELLL